MTRVAATRLAGGEPRAAAIVLAASPQPARPSARASRPPPAARLANALAAARGPSVCSESESCWAPDIGRSLARPTPARCRHPPTVHEMPEPSPARYPPDVYFTFRRSLAAFLRHAPATASARAPVPLHSNLSHPASISVNAHGRRLGPYIANGHRSAPSPSRLTGAATIWDTDA